MTKLKLPPFNTNILLLFGFFILLHVALLNINVAEWGDSYRILRASEYIREFTYPTDEKRPPLYSAVLSIRPAFTDAVLWGRIIMFFVSVMSFAVFYKLCNLVFKKNQKITNLALLIFMLNPVFLYWSLRIMADAFFTLFALVVFFILSGTAASFSPRPREKEETSAFRPKSLTLEKTRAGKFYYSYLLIGFIVGLSVLTRFEGYILFGVVGLGIFFLQGLNLNLVKTLKNQAGYLMAYLAGFFVIALPYLYFRNPLTSTYLEEPARRAYDLEMILIYILSVVFMFGFTSALFFIVYGYKDVANFFKNHVGMASFIIVELILVLLWPAAVPRLFVAFLPFLILPLALAINNYFEQKQLVEKNVQVRITEVLKRVCLVLLLLLAYVLGQYYFRLQFLVVIKPLFALIILINLINIIFIYKKHFAGFVATLALSMFIWSLATIYIHKDIFRVVVEANHYTVNNLQGIIGYNDISSVSEWYLVASNPKNIQGVPYDLTVRSNREYEKLVEKEVQYLLVTNEHNTTMSLDLQAWPHLEEIAEFKEYINGNYFWTKIIRFNRL